ncbi:hypothetical protein JCM10908_000437 [Rhodotorula pacifica]|uniref:uncharacterized protein n=1 Tax=Rhodotorula pacifica TaxID=1495444 RepID=UPI00316DE985
MPAAAGPKDRWHLLSAVEKLHPYFILGQPHNLQLLLNGVQALEHTPVALDGLHDWFCARIPDLRDHYSAYPNAVRLFHIDHTLAAIQAKQALEESIDVLIGQLMCLKATDAFPPLDPRSTGPTAEFCVSRSEYLLDEKGYIVHWSETFRICIVPALEARSMRLDLAGTCQPMAWLYDVARLVIQAELISMTKAHGATIRRVHLFGAWAMKVADVLPASTSVNIVDLHVYSILFARFVIISYHPRLQRASRHCLVRSLCLYREVCLDALSHGLLGLEVRYSDLAVDFGDRPVVTYAYLTTELGVDGADESIQGLEFAFQLASDRLKYLIRTEGTGTHDGGAGGVDIANGGGCGIRRKLDADRTPPDHGSFEETAKAFDFEEMRSTLEAAGFYVETYDDERVLASYEKAIPWLKTRQQMCSLGNAELLSFAENELPSWSSSAVQALSSAVLATDLDNSTMSSRYLDQIPRIDAEQNAGLEAFVTSQAGQDCGTFDTTIDPSITCDCTRNDSDVGGPSSSAARPDGPEPALLTTVCSPTSDAQSQDPPDASVLVLDCQSSAVDSPSNPFESSKTRSPFTLTPPSTPTPSSSASRSLQSLIPLSPPSCAVSPARLLASASASASTSSLSSSSSSSPSSSPFLSPIPAKRSASGPSPVDDASSPPSSSSRDARPRNRRKHGHGCGREGNADADLRFALEQALWRPNGEDLAALADQFGVDVEFCAGVREQLYTFALADAQRPRHQQRFTREEHNTARIRFGHAFVAPIATGTGRRGTRVSYVGMEY